MHARDITRDISRDNMRPSTPRPPTLERRGGPPWLDLDDGIPPAWVRYFAEQWIGRGHPATAWLGWYAGLTCPFRGEPQEGLLRPDVAQRTYLNGPYFAECEPRRRPLPKVAEVKRFRVTLGRPVPLRRCPKLHDPSA